MQSGATGTGKSTTLAAMINHLNETRSLNIISLEDPIEFVHPSKNCQVIQRELTAVQPRQLERRRQVADIAADHLAGGLIDGLLVTGGFAATTGA